MPAVFKRMAIETGELKKTPNTGDFSGQEKVGVIPCWDTGFVVDRRPEEHPHA